MNISKIRWSDLFKFSGSFGLTLIVLACLLISAALGYQVPLMIANLGRNYHHEVLFYADLKFLFFIFLGVYINRVAFQVSINVFIKLLTQNIRSLCYDRWLLNYDIQTEEHDKSERYPQGEVIARIMNDTEALRELITSGTFGIFIDIFFVFANLIGFIRLNKFSGWFISISEVSAAILLIWGSKYMRSIFLSVRAARGEMSKTIANVVGGVSETYYTDHQNYASQKGEIVFHDFLVKQLRSNVWDASYYSLAESLYPLLLALVVFIFPYSQITEAAIIFAIVDLIQRSIGPVKDISGKIANIQRSHSGLVRISEFFGDLEYSQKEGAIMGSSVAVEKFDSMKVDIPNFQYPQRGAEDSFSLKDISFSAKKGELVGIVGISGSGKSTLLGIMAANIIPPNASLKLIRGDSVLIDFPGKNSENVIPYRQVVGIVSQESHIFSETVEFNITMSHEPKEDFEEFWHWMKGRIPYLEEWGIKSSDVINIKTLSLGQKQLLSAIRSCYLKKPVVLFDEISSGLDSDLEIALRKVVLVIQEQSLTFIVAHRLETIIGASKILVMDNGRLVDSGTHHELEKTSSIYCQFLKELMQ